MVATVVNLRTLRFMRLLIVFQGGRRENRPVSLEKAQEQFEYLALHCPEFIQAVSLYDGDEQVRHKDDLGACWDAPGWGQRCVA